jgi:hypothetical protein
MPRGLIRYNTLGISTFSPSVFITACNISAHRRRAISSSIAVSHRSNWRASDTPVQRMR